MPKSPIRDNEIQTTTTSTIMTELNKPETMLSSTLDTVAGGSALACLI